jgi:hypothetical protein
MAQIALIITVRRLIAFDGYNAKPSGALIGCSGVG